MQESFSFLMCSSSHVSYHSSFVVLNDDGFYAQLNSVQAPRGDRYLNPSSSASRSATAAALADVRKNAVQLAHIARQHVQKQINPKSI